MRTCGALCVGWKSSPGRKKIVQDQRKASNAIILESLIHPQRVRSSASSLFSFLFDTSSHPMKFLGHLCSPKITYIIKTTASIDYILYKWTILSNLTLNIFIKERERDNGWNKMPSYAILKCMKTLLLHFSEGTHIHAYVWKWKHNFSFMWGPFRCTSFLHICVNFPKTFNPIDHHFNLELISITIYQSAMSACPPRSSLTLMFPDYWKIILKSRILHISEVSRRWAFWLIPELGWRKPHA